GRIVNNLIGCHERLEQFDRAEAWRRKWLAVVKERSGADSVPCAGQLAALGANLLQQKKWTGAEAVLRECLAIREKKQPDAWPTFHTRSLLGAALLGQEKYAEAEPLLVRGYQGIKKQWEKDLGQQHHGSPARQPLSEALGRLVQLHDARDNKAEADRWRKELATLKAGPRRGSK